MSALGSFFKFVMNVCGIVTNAAAEKASEIASKRAEYEDKSDEALFRVLKSGNGIFSNSGTEKGIAYRILLERGYSHDDIKSRLA